MKRFWSYILLLCFVVLSAPQELFHDHSDHHAVEDQNIPSFEGDDCFACDFDFTCFVAPITVASEITFSLGDIGYFNLIYSEVSKETISIFQRGPPSIS